MHGCSTCLMCTLHAVRAIAWPHQWSPHWSRLLYLQQRPQTSHVSGKMGCDHKRNMRKRCLKAKPLGIPRDCHGLTSSGCLQPHHCLPCAEQRSGLEGPLPSPSLACACQHPANLSGRNCCKVILPSVLLGGRVHEVSHPCEVLQKAKEVPPFGQTKRLCSIGSSSCPGLEEPSPSEICTASSPGSC